MTNVIDIKDRLKNKPEGVAYCFDDFDFAILGTKNNGFYVLSEGEKIEVDRAELSNILWGAAMHVDPEKIYLEQDQEVVCVDYPE